MTIPVILNFRKYKINPPEFLNREEYERLKFTLTVNPDEKINFIKTKIPVKEFFLTEAFYILLFTVFFFTGFFLNKADNIFISFPGTLLIIAGIFGGAGGFVFSFFSFAVSCLLPMEYFYRCRKCIIKSESYEHFIKLFIATHNANLKLSDKNISL